MPLFQTTSITAWIGRVNMLRRLSHRLTIPSMPALNPSFTVRITVPNAENTGRITFVHVQLIALPAASHAARRPANAGLRTFSHIQRPAFATASNAAFTMLRNVVDLL